MAREHFFYDENRRHLQLLDEAARRSGVSRGQAWDDFLVMGVAALAGGAMEGQYMDVVEKHTEGEPGKRGCDSLAQLFGSVVNAMEDDPREGMRDILGDLFQGGVSYGEHGLYLTPEPVARMMATLCVHDVDDPTQRLSVADCCAGTGRMLLAVAEQHRHWDFYAQDVDVRCVRVSALNLGLRNLYGYCVLGDSLTLERKLVYRTGFNGRGVIREIPSDACPYPVASPQTASSDAKEPILPTVSKAAPPPDDEPPPDTLVQRNLF